MKLIAPLLLLAGLTPTIAFPKPSSGTWRTLSNITIGSRQENSVVSLDGKVYLLGGLLPSSNASVDPTTNLVQSYSVARDTWSTEAPLPKALNHLNVVVVKGKIYVLGGLEVGPGTAWPNWLATGDSWVYSPDDKRWASIPSMPAGTERGSSAVGVKGDVIYLAGGLNQLSIFGYNSVNTTSAYDTKKKTWTILKSLPTPLDHSVAVVIKDTFYVVGGRINGTFAGNQATVYTLDLSAKKKAWALRPSKMPTARSGLAGAAVGNVIYTFGGEGNPNATSGVYPQVEAYDTKKDVWTSLDPMPVPRHGTGAAEIGGKIYIPGGGIVQSLGGTDHFDVFKP